VVASLAVAAVALASSVPVQPARSDATLAVVQMNLCNSGLAKATCYAGGKAVDEAVAMIRRYQPDLVTLQEICRDDLYARDGWGKLARAMAALYGDDRIGVAFEPAFNRDTGDWYRCADGELFGVAVLHRFGVADVHHGWYRSQDASEEVRAWVCVTLAARRLTGCTTHLSTDRAIALRQCQELMADLAAGWAKVDVVVAGDFNLTDGVQRCAPATYDRRGDGALQHVLFTRDVHWVAGGTEPMRWTDHPMLYERFRT
jgi:endonuclease/exonuclease/phosphatase family metal-dependent hydrolase